MMSWLPAHSLNIKEASLLASGVIDTSEKSLETLIRKEVLPAGRIRLGGREKRVIHPRSMFFLMLNKLVHSVKMSREAQAKFAHWIVATPTREVMKGSFDIARGLSICLSAYESELMSMREKTLHYMVCRNHIIHSDPSIRGGTPIIRGTRLSVHSLLERHEAGDTIDDLVDDYPNLGIERIEAAIMYARANPRNGRPINRPWRMHAETKH